VARRCPLGVCVVSLRPVQALATLSCFPLRNGVDSFSVVDYLCANRSRFVVVIVSRTSPD
jgi:hypothetical protein